MWLQSDTVKSTDTTKTSCARWQRFCLLHHSNAPDSTPLLCQPSHCLNPQWTRTTTSCHQSASHWTLTKGGSSKLRLKQRTGGSLRSFKMVSPITTTRSSRNETNTTKRLWRTYVSSLTSSATVLLQGSVYTLQGTTTVLALFARLSKWTGPLSTLCRSQRVLAPLKPNCCLRVNHDSVQKTTDTNCKSHRTETCKFFLLISLNVEICVFLLWIWTDPAWSTPTWSSYKLKRFRSWCRFSKVVSRLWQNTWSSLTTRWC